MTKKNSIKILLLLILIFFFYLLIQPGHIYSVDGSVRFELAKALLRGKLYLNQHLFCTANFNGKYYTRWVPGQSILALPLVFIGRIFDNQIEKKFEFISASEFMFSHINIFVALAIVLIILFFSKSWGYKRWVTNLLVIGFVFSGYQLIYVRNTFNNMQVGLFLFLSIFLFYLYQISKDVKLWIWIGLSLGFAAITRITVLPLVLIYFLYFVFLTKRKLVSPKALFISFLVFLPFLIFDVWYGFLIKKGVSLGYFPSYDSNFSIDVFTNCSKNLFSSGCGLIFYCPIAFLGIISLFYIVKKNKAIGFLFAITLVYYIILTSSLYPHLGWGPRFLLPAIPFLIFALGELLDRCKKKLIVPIVSFLLIVGFFIQFPSILVNYRRFFDSYALMKEKGVEEVNITWSIRNSPIITQWTNLYSILAMPEEKKASMLYNKRNFGNLEEVLKHDITLNSIDLWYVYLYLYLKYK